MAILQMKKSFEFSYLKFNLRGEPLTGCFTVAFAVSLLFGGNPSSLLYNHKEMQAYLKEFLLAELFTTFLAS